MFDPARDEDPGNQRFWSRTLRTCLVAFGLGLVALPAVMGFRVPTPRGATQDCVAIVHAWEPTGPRGACVPESRHRLALTSVGGVVVLVTGLLVTVATRRRRTRAHEHETPFAFEFTAPPTVEIAPSIAAAFRGASMLPAHERQTAAP